jgi:hypothetical protein
MGASVARRLRATVLGFFAVASAADRDEADRFFMAICHCGRPEGLPDLTNEEKPRFVRGPSGKLDAVLVQPQRLRLHEIDAVLRLVCG